MVKNPPANAGATGNSTSIPGSRRSSGEGHGNPPQYSCPANSLDRGSWRATVRERKESDRLSTQQRRSQHSARWGSFFSCVRREILAGSQFPGKDAGVAAPWLRVARGKGGGNWSSGCTSLEASSAPPPVRSLPPRRRLRSRVSSSQLSPRECGRPHSRALKLCPLPALALRRRHTNEPLCLTHFLPRLLPPQGVKKATSPHRRCPSFLGKKPEVER